MSFWMSERKMNGMQDVLKVLHWLIAWQTLEIWAIRVLLPPTWRDVNSAPLPSIVVRGIYMLCILCDLSDGKSSHNATFILFVGTGSRATSAIQVLLNSGFRGKLFNGQGTSQWTSAGYPLVTGGDSVVPPCTTSGQDSCAAAAAPPTEAPNKGAILDRKEPKPGSKDGFKFARTRTGTDLVTQIGIRGGGGQRRRLANLMPEEMDEYIGQ